ncbi:MAG: phenylacetate--CoA ligase family protein [Candidatus Tectomicrobia bacterium]|nr:phenylacetate--CoA ligase family protein [Candidatus Tectomicrobia bacterium]
MCLDAKIEMGSRAELRAVQEERFQVMQRHAYEHSPLMRRKFDSVGLRPSDLPDLSHLPKLPFVTKDELRESQVAVPPYGDFMGVPVEKCLRIHQTSATTGRPLLVLDAWEDWRGLYLAYARALYAAGVRPADMAMPAFSFGPWIGFWLSVYALQEIGALLYPSGGMSTEQRLDTLLTYPITVVGCTPSYALYMIEQARRKGIDLATQSKVRLTFHTGEPGASIAGTKRRLQEGFGALAFDLPGLTEVVLWGFECAEQSGKLHLNEDYCYCEILDPESGAEAPPGDVGELVVTNLFRKSLPLLRYRTRDLVRRAAEPCPCGRTLACIDGGIIGRLDDMKKVRGVIVYPSRVEEAVRRFEAADEFQIIFRRRQGLDDILVRVDPSPTLAEEERQHLRQRMSAELRNELGLRVSVEIVASGSLPRFEHKARRVVDERTEVPF